MVDDATISSFYMLVPISPDISPDVKILVFYVVNGEVIPDSTLIKVAKCLKNPVIIIFLVD